MDDERSDDATIRRIIQNQGVPPVIRPAVVIPLIVVAAQIGCQSPRYMPQDPRIPPGSSLIDSSQMESLVIQFVEANLKAYVHSTAFSVIQVQAMPKGEWSKVDLPSETEVLNAEIWTVETSQGRIGLAIRKLGANGAVSGVMVTREPSN